MDPESTANAPLRLDLCPSRYAFSVDSSVASTVLVAISDTLYLLPSTDTAPS